jgi:acyl-CoA reductase-like NAD-dependent aldehyde dehydrogenase
VPENVFQIAIGGPETGKAFTSLPFDAFYFTGSYNTGKLIYEKLSARMIPCHCELGGKDPLYVADDVQNIAAVAAATADGAFYNNGQSCCAVERLYVHEKIYDDFIREFVQEVGTYRSGSPEEEGIYIGAITRESQLEVLRGQVDEAVRLGAKILTGGKRMDRQGNYFEPTVLAEVSHHMKIMRDESFGPLIGIMKVKDDEEAIRLMRDTEYGLTASVYSADRERATAILSQIDAGTGYWNCCDRVSAPLPWSGRKHSGIGVTLSHAGLRAMTKMKAYHLISPKP